MTLRRPFVSLTSRLVVTVVVLVAVVGVLVSAVSAVAMRGYLLDRLDDDVRASLAAYRGPSDGRGPGPGPAARFDGRNQAPGTLNAFVGGDVSRAEVLGEGRGQSTELGDDALGALADLPADGRVHQVEVPGAGTYRVVATDASLVSSDGNTQDGVLITGLPTEDVDETISSLLAWGLLLALVGTAAAALVGEVMVRRQLRPLTEVAETAHAVAALPLASGEIELAPRVPDRLTDERTEVGRVGAALNQMLAHVESALAARHRSEQQVRQFVADASHELRTPLATIAGYTELARRRPDDAEAATTALDKVEEESRRMTGLVEDLLLLARLDAGRPLAREPVDLTRLLLEAVSDARVLSADHRWRLDLPPRTVEVLGDEQRLHQVVTNLLANARRHTPAGTTVTVSAFTGPDGTGLAVHDDGPGFPPEIAERAFERFVRGDASRNRNGGAGLGLALVQAIVWAHGGRVQLSSDPGDTTVRVSLPPARPPQAAGER